MKKLLIIFQSSISRVDSIYWGKEIFVEYFYGLSERFDLSLLAPLSKQRQHFHSVQIEQDKFSKIIGIPQKIRRNIFKKSKIFSQHIKASDVVMIFMPTISGVWAAFLCRLLNKKYVLYLGTDWRILEEEKLKNQKGLKYICAKPLPWLKDRLLLQAFKHCLFALVTGGALRRKYENYCKVYETRPIINLRASSIHYRDSHDLHKPVRLLFVGALFKRKGVHDLIEAMQFLPDNLSFQLDIVGDGPDKEYFVELADQLKLKDQINFLGFITNGPQLFDLYQSADVFILPSYLEGFPRVVYEAFCHGAPVITTVVGGIANLLQDGTQALFINQRDPEDIARKITLLCEDHDLRRKLTQNGYELLEKILAEPAAKQHADLINEYVQS